MEDKIKDMEAMESVESAKSLDSRELEAVSGGWEEPRCKNSDCVLIDTKDGVFWRTNHYYRCKKCGNYFMKGWALDGADNSLLYKK